MSRVLLALAPLLLLLAGCGDATGDAAPDAPAPSLTAPGLRLGEVRAVRAAPGGRALRVTIAVAAGEPGCASRVRVRDEGRSRGVVRGTPVYRTSGGRCAEVAERTVRWSVPRHTREVALDLTAWRPGPGSSWVACGAVGCNPPADRCADAWTSQVAAGSELPPEQRIDVVACGSGGLVVDVDAVVTGCQSVDGSTPPGSCAGTGVHTRWYAVPDRGRGWRVVASGTGPGCTDVVAVDPTFPRSLCERLSAR